MKNAEDRNESSNMERTKGKAKGAVIFGCFKNAEARILDYRRTGKKEARL